MVVTRKTNLGEILDADPTTAVYFLEIGMHCLGCHLQEVKISNRLAMFTVQMLTNW